MLYSKGTGSTPTIGVGQPVPINSINDLPQNVNISPKQLYELTNNLSEMTTWGKPGTDLQNSILERLYGSYSGRLKNISPELASAQQAYARLRGFQKNEGLNRVLSPKENIDSAAETTAGNAAKSHAASANG